MSNIHGIYQSQSSLPGKYNPYANEGFAPISASTTDNNSGQVDMTSVKIKELMKYAIRTFSFWIILIQFIAFVTSYIIYYTKKEDWNCVLLDMGAKFEPKIKFHHQFYRLIIPIILHAGLAHFLSNLVSQIFLNIMLEKRYGIIKFVIVFFCSGLGGNLLSCVMYPKDISVGASSALFGIMALFGAFLIQNYHTMGARKNFNILFYAIILIGNFSFTFQQSDNANGPAIDVGAHLGIF